MLVLSYLLMVQLSDSLWVMVFLFISIYVAYFTNIQLIKIKID